MNHISKGSKLQNGKYQILEMLGQGGFGITYLATQAILDRKVAIKEFFPKDYCDRNHTTSHITIGTTSNIEFVGRLKAKFIKEARNISKLNHPGIVKIYDIFEENDTAYYVMDYIEGESLADRLKHRGVMSSSEAVAVILQVGEALQYIHSFKMNHLDVKPANIMLRHSDGKPILIDFGLSKQYDGEGNQTSTTPVGISHGYAPMEQYRRTGVVEFSPQSDVYSLGATLYKMLTGFTPPEATEMIDNPLNIPANRVPANIANVIRKAMAVKKTDRYATVKEFCSALRSPSPMGGRVATPPPFGNISGATVGDDSTVIDGATTVIDGSPTVLDSDKVNFGVPPVMPPVAPKQKKGKKRWIIALIIAAVVIASLVTLFLVSVNRHTDYYYEEPEEYSYDEEAPAEATEEASDTAEAPRETDREVSIKNVSSDTDVYNGGTFGMYVVVDFNATYYKDETLKVIVYFYDEDNSIPLRDANGDAISYYRYESIPYDDCSVTNSKVFVPYDDLPYGTSSFDVAVVDGNGLQRDRRNGYLLHLSTN